MGRHSKPDTMGEMMTVNSSTATAAPAVTIPDQSRYKVTLMSLRDKEEFTNIVMVDTDNLLHMWNRARLAIELKHPERAGDYFTLVSIIAVP